MAKEIALMLETLPIEPLYVFLSSSDRSFDVY